MYAYHVQLIHVLVTHEFTIISDDISSSLVKMLFEMAFRIKHSGMCITVVHSQIDGSFLLYQRLLHDVLYTLFHRYVVWWCIMLLIEGVFIH